MSAPRLATLTLCCLLLGCADAAKPPPATPSPPAMAAAPSESASVPAAIRAIIDADDRSADDRKLDEGRHPGELLAFYGIAPGMRVAEIMAGGGYTAELLARAVGPTGTVYGQNSRWVLDRFAEAPWAARLQKPINQRVVRVDRELEDPLPPEARELDAVFLVLFYHDSVWMETDRAKMNAAIFAALKPGGTYAVVDHSARAGAGLDEVKSLHRIEESLLRREVEEAGFEFVSSADFLRNPADARDWSASPSMSGERRGTSDRFVLEFKKPE